MNEFRNLFRPLEREILSGLRRRGPRSRAELAAVLNARPNSVGEAVTALLSRHLVRESEPVASAAGAGRPRVPVAVDDTGRAVLGVAVDGGLAQVRAVNLLGRPVGPVWRGGVDEAADAVRSAAGKATLGVAITVPGLVELDHGTDGAGPAALGAGRASEVASYLSSLLGSCGGLPTLVDNDVHALAARWSWTQRDADTEGQDVLLVRVGDGALGASVLVNGRPNRGCVVGGNELGHTRLPVDTERCFCGQVGCLERIVSTPFLHRHGASTVRTLAELCSAFPSGVEGDDAAVAEMTDWLAMGISNAVQLLRPHRVVLVSELTRFDAWYKRLLGSARSALLAALRRRVCFERWDEPLSSPAESAAHRALSAVYDAAWA